MGSGIGSSIESTSAIGGTTTNMSGDTTRPAHDGRYIGRSVCGYSCYIYHSRGMPVSTATRPTVTMQVQWWRHTGGLRVLQRLDWTTRNGCLHQQLGWANQACQPDKKVELSRHASLRILQVMFCKSGGLLHRFSGRAHQEAMPVRLKAVHAVCRTRGDRKFPVKSVDTYAQDLRRLFLSACSARDPKCRIQGTIHRKLSMGRSVLSCQFVTGLQQEIKVKLAGVEGTFDQLLARPRLEEAIV